MNTILILLLLLLSTAVTNNATETATPATDSCFGLTCTTYDAAVRTNASVPSIPPPPFITLRSTVNDLDPQSRSSTARASGSDGDRLLVDPAAGTRPARTESGPREWRSTIAFFVTTAVLALASIVVAIVFGIKQLRAANLQTRSGRNDSIDRQRNDDLEMGSVRASPTQSSTGGAGDEPEASTSTLASRHMQPARQDATPGSFLGPGPRSQVVAVEKASPQAMSKQQMQPGMEPPLAVSDGAEHSIDGNVQHAGDEQMAEHRAMQVASGM